MVAFDIVGMTLVGCFAVFLLAGLSVVVRGVWRDWRSYRTRVRTAWLSRKD